MKSHCASCSVKKTCLGLGKMLFFCIVLYPLERYLALEYYYATN